MSAWAGKYVRGWALLHRRGTKRDGHTAKLPDAGAFLWDTPAGGRYNSRTVHELLGHRNVNTTMIYTHVLNR